MIKQTFGFVARDIIRTPLQSRLLGAGRTIIALAQLSFILLTPAEYFLIPVGGIGVEERCADSFSSLSAYCLWGNHQAVSYALSVLLIIVASGFAPRWTSLFHFWVSYSIAMVIGLPDGGESVVSAVTLFYFFASLNDARLWHWQKPERESSLSVSAGIAWAGSWLIRIQMAFIYIWGGLSKLAVESWQDGTAVYYVSRMEYFGAAGIFDGLIRDLLSVPLIALGAAWGTIIVECAIAILLLVNKRTAGIVALTLCILMHLGIAMMIGIFSFATIMIGGVMIAASYSICRTAFPRQEESDEEVHKANTLASA